MHGEIEDHAVHTLDFAPAEILPIEKKRILAMLTIFHDWDVGQAALAAASIFACRALQQTTRSQLPQPSRALRVFTFK